jgi:GNAT superfamily N-acetyltransferase
VIDHVRTDGVHWFEQFDDGGESTGHALVREYPDHAELARVWVNPHYRGRGAGGRLVDAVTSHFDERGKPVQLKPMSCVPASRGGSHRRNTWPVIVGSMRRPFLGCPARARHRPTFLPASITVGARPECTAVPGTPLVIDSGWGRTGELWPVLREVLR